MNFCLICDEYPPAPHGGIGSNTRDLAEGLATHGHSVTVLGVTVTQPVQSIVHEKVHGVRIVRLPRARDWCPHRWRMAIERKTLRRWLRRLHREQPFDLVECPDYEGWLPHGGLPGVPLVMRINGSNFFFDAELERPPSLHEHRYELATLRQANHLAASSAYAARRTLELAGFPERPCEVIPNTVDADYFSPSPDITPKAGLIVFVNSLNPKKGIEQLIDAANLLLPTHPQARLVIIGGDTQRKLGGRYLDGLKARAVPELRERIQFLGHQPRDQVRDWLRRAAIGCYPSHMETFGIAPVECMSVGRPTIYTRLGPGPEVIQDGINGLLCDPHDPADIARCLTRLLADPAAAERLGTAARKRVLTHFDKRGWIQRNLDFYRRCGTPS